MATGLKEEPQQPQKKVRVRTGKRFREEDAHDHYDAIVIG